MNRRLFICIRVYTTKSKTASLRMKASMPLKQVELVDNSLFIANLTIVAPNIQAQVAPTLHKSNDKEIIRVRDY